MQPNCEFAIDSPLPNSNHPLSLSSLVRELPAKSFGALFCLYLFVVIVLPSGSILGVNFKLGLYGLLLPSALSVLLSDGRMRLSEVALLLMTPTVLLVWVVEAQVYGFEIAGTLRQYTDILLTLLTCWLASLFCRRSEQAKLQFLRTLIFSATVASSLKAGLVVFAMARGVPVTSLVNAIDRIFGVELMTMDLGALLGRIQFISDGLIPLCVFAILCYRQRLRIGALASVASLTLLIFSMILSFSRYFWAYTLLGLAMGLILSRKDRVFAFLTLTGLIATISTLPLLNTLYQTRFSQEVAGQSDSARVEQIQALDSFFLDAPLFGHGLGSYTSRVVRSQSNAKYGYEVQILALAGQMGLAGTTLLAFLCAFYLRCLWPENRSELFRKSILCLLLLGWLASGLFNPLLMNPVGALSYASIMCMGSLTPFEAQSYRRTFETQHERLVPIGSRGDIPG